MHTSRPTSDRRGQHLLQSAGLLLRDVTTRFLARRLNRDSTEEWQLINKESSQPARTFFTGTLHSETLLVIALEAHLGLQREVALLRNVA